MPPYDLESPEAVTAGVTTSGPVVAEARDDGDVLIGVVPALPSNPLGSLLRLVLDGLDVGGPVGDDAIDERLVVGARGLGVGGQLLQLGEGQRRQAERLGALLPREGAA